MSMSADIQNVFIDAHQSFGVRKEVCAKLFIDVMSALEWDLDDHISVSSDDPEWQQKELNASIKMLFGEEAA